MCEGVLCLYRDQRPIAQRPRYDHDHDHDIHRPPMEDIYNIAGPGLAALKSLTDSQISFLQSLPKAELHAHLNGCIPLSCLQELALEHDFADSANSSSPSSTTTSTSNNTIAESLRKLRDGVELREIADFFSLFPAIYELTSTPAAIAKATRAVLVSFLEGTHPQCTYIELRSTPRATSHMSRREYLESVLSEVEKYPADKAAFIVSIDRRMSLLDVEECVELAIELRKLGRRIVGIDLCGDPLVCASPLGASTLTLKQICES